MSLTKAPRDPRIDPRVGDVLLRGATGDVRRPDNGGVRRVVTDIGNGLVYYTVGPYGYSMPLSVWQCESDLAKVIHAADYPQP